ncbi:MAG TPA: Xaa-Pro peptidase family protein [Trueperaceae bacterium]|nr:Xaa-Pro peptidase family protein [Trueperaceae bacterium]
MLLNRDKAQQLMRSEGLDALVLTYTENVIAFTDFMHVNSNRIKPRLYYVAFFADPRHEPVFLVPHQDYDDAKRHTWIKDVRRTAEYVYPGRTDVIVDKVATVAHVIEEAGLAGGSIGFEDGSLPYGVYTRLVEALPRATFKPAGHLLARLRAIKSAEELHRIKKAMDATQAGANAIRDNIRPGITEKELAALAKEACLEAGGEYVDFLIVGAAQNGAIVHGTPSDYALQDGDIIRFDLGAVYASYPGDFARTYVVGDSPSERDSMHYEAVRAAVAAGVEAVGPGVTAGQVYDAMMAAGSAIDPELRREHAGHGMGLEIHEEPMIYQGSRFVLEPGMIVMIECGRYIMGQAGYQLEDLVLVTEQGREVLTDVSRDLVITR